MKTFIAGRDAFLQLKEAVQNATKLLTDSDVVLMIKQDGVDVKIREARFISPDSIAFHTMSNENSSTIFPIFGGKNFLADIFTREKIESLPIVTSFVGLNDD